MFLRSYYIHWPDCLTFQFFFFFEIILCSSLVRTRGWNARRSTVAPSIFIHWEDNFFRKFHSFDSWRFLALTKFFDNPINLFVQILHIWTWVFRIDFVSQIHYHIVIVGTSFHSQSTIAGLKVIAADLSNNLWRGR